MAGSALDVAPTGLSLSGKVAVVTGSGGGIGAATAELLAQRGASVVVADIDEPAAAATAGAISAQGLRAEAHPVDVSDEGSVMSLLAWTHNEFGGLDVLHNNAAVMAPDVLGRDLDLDCLDTDVWDRTIAVNVRGPMLGCKHAIPYLRERGGGAIINTSSVAGRSGDVRFVSYGVSKAGVDLLTKCVASRYGREGIRCNAVAPGMVLTPTAQRTLTRAQIDGAMRHHLSPRAGRPDDIAQAVAFLASDAGSFVNGHVLYVDGGVSAHLPHCAEALEELSI
jgi:NAD(P)-dependent dehydrogenase (short-subunit alcohol dehydrogenase family)